MVWFYVFHCKEQGHNVILPIPNSHLAVFFFFFHVESVTLAAKANLKAVRLEKHEQGCFFRTQRKPHNDRCGVKQLCASDYR